MTTDPAFGEDERRTKKRRNEKRRENKIGRDPRKEGKRGRERDSS